MKALGWIVVVVTLCAVAAPAAGSGASWILFNATVVCMTAPDEAYDAIALIDDRIAAVGPLEALRPLADQNTRWSDLGGRAVYPGFIDAHTHLLDACGPVGLTVEQAQRLALSYGVTSAADMLITPGNLDELVAEAIRGNVRVRMSLYLAVNDPCGQAFGPWYLEYEPLTEIAPRLRVGGVKIFAERSSCGSEPIGMTFTPPLADHLSPAGETWYGSNIPLFGREELSEILAQATGDGFPVAIHAIGDAGIELALDALAEINLPLGPLRPMILHNTFLRDDLLPRFTRQGVIAAVETVNPCFVQFYDEMFPTIAHSLVRRWGDLSTMGTHMVSDSDWPWHEAGAFHPMSRLEGLVSASSIPSEYEQWMPCRPLSPGHVVTIWQGLRMMTTEAAYALHRDDELGSLEPGKLADLVILSGDPRATDPSELHRIEIDATIIAGTVEWEDGTVFSDESRLGPSSEI